MSRTICLCTFLFHYKCLLCKNVYINISKIYLAIGKKGRQHPYAILEYVLKINHILCILTFIYEIIIN
jgi:hypothetical protein